LSVPIRIQTYYNVFNLKIRNLPWPSHSFSCYSISQLALTAKLVNISCFHFLTSDSPVSPFWSSSHSYVFLKWFLVLLLLLNSVVNSESLGLTC
jgi:hypothetical protein